MSEHRTTTVTKRYSPPRLAADSLAIEVDIEVRSTDDDEALALADCLYNAVADTHRAFVAGDETDETDDGR